MDLLESKGMQLIPLPRTAQEAIGIGSTITNTMMEKRVTLPFLVTKSGFGDFLAMIC